MNVRQRACTALAISIIGAHSRRNDSEVVMTLSRRTVLLGCGAAGLAGVAGIAGYQAWRTSSETSPATNLLSLRLSWYPQTEFAGFLLARERGLYTASGLNVEIRGAGPDLRPQNALAAGTDDVAIVSLAQAMIARSNGVPIKIIAQVFHDSIFRYVIKRPNAITDLKDLKGMAVGLWMAGDETEFLAMLASVGLTKNDVRIVPQEFSVVPFLNDNYAVSAVTVGNELIQIRRSGYEGDALQVLSPADYGVAIPANAIAVLEPTLRDRRDDLVKFLRQSVAGWEAAFAEPQAAVQAALQVNNELNAEQQLAQLQAVEPLMKYGVGARQLMSIDRDEYVRAMQVLRSAETLERDIDIDSLFDSSLMAEVHGQR